MDMPRQWRWQHRQRWQWRQRQRWRQQRLQRWQQWQWQWRQRQPWQRQQGLRRRQWRQRRPQQRLALTGRDRSPGSSASRPCPQHLLFSQSGLGPPWHPEAMGCLCCRHKPTDYDDLPGPNPQRPIYDDEGYAIDKLTRRRLQRTYSSEFSGHDS